MASADTESPSSGPSTGPSQGSSGDHASGSNESEATSFDTQPPSSQEDYDDAAAQGGQKAWGQLTVIGGDVTIDLCKDEYKVGRGEQNDLILHDRVKPTSASSLWKACSKLQFNIHREDRVGGMYTFVEDHSTNGTFVNNELVGKGKFCALQNGDLISLVKKQHRAYIYIDCDTKQENSDIPMAVRDEYMLLKVLGSGACGVVKLAIRKKDKYRVACKCINKDVHKFSYSESQNLMKEVNILKRLDHPGIIKLVDVIDTEKMLYIFMELVEGGDLFREITTQKRLDPSQAKALFYQTCLAVKYLHDNHIVHRDLKPENILLSSVVPDKQIVKVTDFGLSNIIGTSSLRQSLCGTPFYIAPEILETAGMLVEGYTKAVDCWSLGVILYISITGQPPFTQERTDLSIKEQILQGNYAIKDKYWEYVSNGKDLVQKLLVVDAKKRLTLDQILQHPFFQDEVMLKQVNDLLAEESRNAEGDLFYRSDSKKRPISDVKENFRSESSTPVMENTLSSKRLKRDTTLTEDGSMLSLSNSSATKMETSSLPDQSSDMYTS